MKASRMLPLFALTALVIAGCGQSGSKLNSKPRPLRRHATSTVTFPDPASRACMATLKPLGIPVGTLYAQYAVGASGPLWSKITLAPSLGGGPAAEGSRQSSVQTAYENVLSSAVGYPLTSYLGATVTQVVLFGGPQGMAPTPALRTRGGSLVFGGSKAGIPPSPSF